MPQPLQGEWTYLDFWASWCGPCKQSFPWMNDMHAKYGNKGRIIAVSVDTRSTGRGPAFSRSNPRASRSPTTDGRHAAPLRRQGNADVDADRPSGRVVMVMPGSSRMTAARWTPSKPAMSRTSAKMTSSRLLYRATRIALLYWHLRRWLSAAAMQPPQAFEKGNLAKREMTGSSDPLEDAFVPARLLQQRSCVGRYRCWWRWLWLQLITTMTSCRRACTDRRFHHACGARAAGPNWRRARRQRRRRRHQRQTASYDDRQPGLEPHSCDRAIAGCVGTGGVELGAGGEPGARRYSRRLAALALGHLGCVAHERPPHGRHRASDALLRSH